MGWVCVFMGLVTLVFGWALGRVAGWEQPTQAHLTARRGQQPDSLIRPVRTFIHALEPSTRMSMCHKRVRHELLLRLIVDMRYCFLPCCIEEGTRDSTCLRQPKLSQHNARVFEGEEDGQQNGCGKD